MGIVEKDVENSLRKLYRRLKGWCVKFTSPGNPGAPDDICLKKIPPEHREIVAKYIIFVECKAPGKKPEPHQVRFHKKLRRLGFTVVILDRKIGSEEIEV